MDLVSRLRCNTVTDCMMAAPEAATRIEELEAVLRELVALKDLKTRLEKLHAMGHGTDYTDYHRCKPIAWQKARELLTPNV